MNLNMLNLLVLVGAIHGLILAALLTFSNRNRRQGNILLALMLAFYTLPVLRVVLIDIGLVKEIGGSFYSIELLYGLGPTLFLYACTTADPEYKVRRRDILHFVPVALEALYYLSPVYRDNHLRIFTPPIDAEHTLWMLEQAGAGMSILIYLGLTNRLLWKHASWVSNNYSNVQKRTLRWLQTPVLLYTMFFLFWFSLRVVDITFFEDRLSVRPYYPFLLFLSIATYWIGTKGYLQTPLERTGSFPRNDAKTLETKIDEDVLIDLFDSLERLLSREQPYLDEELTLSQLADSLSVNRRLLSKAINTQAGTNFYDYVNRYRIEEFKRRMPNYPAKHPVLTIAFECGFGSKATFNHAFKKIMHVTPTQYRKMVLSPE